jgi:ribonuclease VapC
MIVDSSALVAILLDEPEAQELREKVAANPARTSAASVLETSIVMRSERQHEIDRLLEDAEVGIVPFDIEQARVARDAYARFGKVAGSRARLNFGDCMVYALAKVTGEPLLFKGDDFTHTDIESAL